MPYSNSHLLTVAPLGFTVAFRVAVVWVADEAEPVTAAGELARHLRSTVGAAQARRPVIAGTASQR